MVICKRNKVPQDSHFPHEQPDTLYWVRKEKQGEQDRRRNMCSRKERLTLSLQAEKHVKSSGKRQFQTSLYIETRIWLGCLNASYVTRFWRNIQHRRFFDLGPISCAPNEVAQKTGDFERWSAVIRAQWKSRRLKYVANNKTPFLQKADCLVRYAMQHATKQS